jgi:lipoprotein NlpI
LKRDNGDLDGALADYNKCIELKPNHASGFVGRGNVMRAKGDLDAAMADYNKAIELKSDDAIAYDNRGMMKKTKGDLNGALMDYDKAIELNPKHAEAYHGRGCLRYDEQKFADALADFRKESELDTTTNASVVRDYGHFRVWLIRARLGEKEAATKEMQAYLDGRKTGKPDDWAAHIARFLAGRLDETGFFKAAENANKKKESGQMCEAWFYAGSKRLIDGDNAKAGEYFGKCVGTGETGFTEYGSAVVELKLLKAGK